MVFCWFYDKLLTMTQMTLLDSNEVARRLNVSRRTLQRMAADGRVPALKAPGYKGAYLFQAEAIDRLEAEKASA